MPETILKAYVRDSCGKKSAKKSRKEGKIPGVLYGYNTQPIPIEMDRQEFIKTYTSDPSAHLISIKLLKNGIEELKEVMIKEVQIDPRTDRVLNVDFYAITPGKPFIAPVPVKIIGPAKGVVEEGGILQFATRTLNIKTLPDKIPPFLEVDVRELSAGKAILIRDLRKLTGYDIRGPQDQAVVLVIETRKTKESAAEKPAEAPAATTATPAEKAEQTKQEKSKPEKE